MRTVERNGSTIKERKICIQFRLKIRLVLNLVVRLDIAL